MGVSVPLPLLVHHSPTYPFKITLGSLKVGLVLGECIVMCCCYLRYSIFNNPTPLLLPLYFALYILKVMGRLHVLSQTKFYPGRCH